MISQGKRKFLADPQLNSPYLSLIPPTGRGRVADRCVHTKVTRSVRVRHCTEVVFLVGM